MARVWLLYRHALAVAARPDPDERIGRPCPFQSRGARWPGRDFVIGRSTKKKLKIMSEKISGRSAVKAFLLGAVSLAFYLILFANETAVLDLAKQAHWMFVVPIAIAFLFSFVHGAFTAAFWDALGIKARK